MLLAYDDASDACRARSWKENTNYVHPRRENARNATQAGKRRRGGPSGLQYARAKADEAVASALAGRLGFCPDAAMALAQRILSPALSSRARETLQQRQEMT